MAKRILILDDDADFNSLLTDIYSQAGYEVISEHDPDQALEKFNASHFDLVVTDQKMPGMTGEEFIREIKAQFPKIPVIMVSGFLDNDTIRNLIREGVGGVFLKPLNVFSLLKRTETLIEEIESTRKGRGTVTQDDTPTPTQFNHSLPFRFETFPAKAARSVDFAKKLYSFRNFKNNLVLIGDEGIDLEAIAADLQGFFPQGEEHVRVIPASHQSVAGLLETIENSIRDGYKRITLVFPNTESLTREQKDAIFAVHKRQRPFDPIALPIRFVFLLRQDIDTLADAGKIDDDLYLFLGTSEIRIPALRDIRDDIQIMASRYLEKEAAGHGLQKVPVFDVTANAYLLEHDWPGNSREMQALMREAAALDKSPLTRADLGRIQEALSSEHDNLGSQLKMKLREFRDDYLLALTILESAESAQGPEAKLQAR